MLCCVSSSWNEVPYLALPRLFLPPVLQHQGDSCVCYHTLENGGASTWRREIGRLWGYMWESVLEILNGSYLFFGPGQDCLLSFPQRQRALFLNLLQTQCMFTGAPGLTMFQSHKEERSGWGSRFSWSGSTPSSMSAPPRGEGLYSISCPSRP